MKIISIDLSQPKFTLGIPTHMEVDIGESEISAEVIKTHYVKRDRTIDIVFTGKVKARYIADNLERFPSGVHVFKMPDGREFITNQNGITFCLTLSGAQISFLGYTMESYPLDRFIKERLEG